MPRPIQAHIHTAALQHNLQRVQSAVPDAKVWAVVKANAYGHGIERVFEGLRAADGFALLDLAEAERVRALGWRGPILLLEGVFEPRDLELCSRLGIWHAVHCDQQIDWLAAHKSQQPQPVLLLAGAHGMAAHHLRSRYARLAALPQVEDVTLWAQASDGAAASALMAALQPVAQDWIGLRSIAVPVHLQAALPWPSLHRLAQQAEQHGWDVELMCCI